MALRRAIVRLCLVTPPPPVPRADASVSPFAGVPQSTLKAPQTIASSSVAANISDGLPPMSVSIRKRTGEPLISSAPLHSTQPHSAVGNVKRIILVRNGQSDVIKRPEVILETPDWRVPLNGDGMCESFDAGVQLAHMIGREPVYIYFSPYLRAKESLRGILAGALKVRKLNIVGIREDARLRDGDIGRYTTKEELLAAMAEQAGYGEFFYRFPHGESGADVCDRVSSFLDVFQREKLSFPNNTTVVIVSHALTIRMFIKRWFHLNVDTFHKTKTIPTARFVELHRTDHDHFKFKLTTESSELLGLPLSLKDEAGYAFRNTQLLGSLSTGAPFL